MTFKFGIESFIMEKFNEFNKTTSAGGSEIGWRWEAYEIFPNKMGFTLN